jgi:hypothetical protein
MTGPLKGDLPPLPDTSLEDCDSCRQDMPCCKEIEALRRDREALSGARDLIVKLWNGRDAESARADEAEAKLAAVVDAARKVDHASVGEPTGDKVIAALGVLQDAVSHTVSDIQN